MTRWTLIAALAVGCSRQPTATEEISGESMRPKVAAVAYGRVGSIDLDPGCSPADRNCAVAALVTRAAAKGARLVVAPEYGLAQRDLEVDPPVGARPDAQLSPIAARFAELAKQLAIYLVVNLQTASDLGTKDERIYNTLLAFDPGGQIVAKHHKFELFEGERKHLTAGQEVSTFDTPFGRVGLLVCADIYGDPRLHEKLVEEKGAEIVAISAQWTVADATRWQSAFARDWGVVVVASNRSGGVGRGSGIYGRDGKPLVISKSPRPAVLVAELPPNENAPGQ